MGWIADGETGLSVRTKLNTIPNDGTIFANGASGQTNVAAPTAPASTSVYKMQGLAGSITPAASGNILIMISGTITSSTVTANDGIKYQLSYGTSTAPSNGGNLAGTQVGTIQTYTNPVTIVAADVHVPFSTQAVVTGLVVGTAYWLDLAAESNGTNSSVALTAVNVTAIEI